MTKRSISDLEEAEFNVSKSRTFEQIECPQWLIVAIPYFYGYMLAVSVQVCRSWRACILLRFKYWLENLGHHPLYRSIHGVDAETSREMFEVLQLFELNQSRKFREELKACTFLDPRQFAEDSMRKNMREDFTSLKFRFLFAKTLGNSILLNLWESYAPIELWQYALERKTHELFYEYLTFFTTSIPGESPEVFCKYLITLIDLFAKVDNVDWFDVNPKPNKNEYQVLGYLPNLLNFIRYAEWRTEDNLENALLPLFDHIVNKYDMLPWLCSIELSISGWEYGWVTLLTRLLDRHSNRIATVNLRWIHYWWVERHLRDSELLPESYKYRYVRKLFVTHQTEVAKFSRIVESSINCKEFFILVKRFAETENAIQLVAKMSYVLDLYGRPQLCFPTGVTSEIQWSEMLDNLKWILPVRNEDEAGKTIVKALYGSTEIGFQLFFGEEIPLTISLVELQYKFLYENPPSVMKDLDLNLGFYKPFLGND